MNNKNYLEQNGFLVIRNLFSGLEIDKLVEISNKLHKNKNSKFGPIHNSKETWGIIANQKIINLVKEVLGTQNIVYLFHGHSVFQDKKTNVDNAWHRDNACRLFGKGPDWRDDYNILRVAIYLDDGDSGLNLIRNSHRGKGYICKFINFLREKYKFIYHKRIFRFFFDNIVGKKIHTNAGDCVFFYANTYHSAINNKKNQNITRRALFLTYGTDNSHAKNHMNYYLFHRTGEGFELLENDKNELLKFLEEKNIKINPPKKKIDIESASI